MTGGMTPFTATTAGTGQRIQAGSKVTVTWDEPTGDGLKTITFPTPFRVAPAVVATTRRSGWFATVSAVSTDSFNVHVANRSASADDGTQVDVDWIAIGV